MTQKQEICAVKYIALPRPRGVVLLYAGGEQQDARARVLGKPTKSLEDARGSAVLFPCI